MPRFKINWIENVKQQWTATIEADSLEQAEKLKDDPDLIYETAKVEEDELIESPHDHYVECEVKDA